ncbi:hypothetical protein H4582DRAFT_2052943 [Lactarius indigo]|nr:hypothetical protein H4582DRAFT_2052943 [Lactarius indigo]
MPTNTGLDQWSGRVRTLEGPDVTMRWARATHLTRGLRHRKEPMFEYTVGHEPVQRHSHRKPGGVYLLQFASIGTNRSPEKWKKPLSVIDNLFRSADQTSLTRSSSVHGPKTFFGVGFTGMSTVGAHATAAWPFLANFGGRQSRTSRMGDPRSSDGGTVDTSAWAGDWPRALKKRIRRSPSGGRSQKNGRGGGGNGDLRAVDVSPGGRRGGRERGVFLAPRSRDKPAKRQNAALTSILGVEHAPYSCMIRRKHLNIKE